MNINENIEEKRQELLRVYLNNSFQCSEPKIVKVSQELDVLLNTYSILEKKKGRD